MKKILLAVLFAGNAFAADYTIDADHSAVGFKVRHLAISTVSGSFSEFEGRFNFDPDKVENSSVEAAIKVSSIDTNQKKRDDHLRSADFFDAEKFPEMKFVSSKVSNITKEGFTLDGTLTIKQVSKPVSLQVVIGGRTKDMHGKERAAFTATTKINRKDFGITWHKVLDSGALVVGDQVDITLEIEGVRA